MQPCRQLVNKTRKHSKRGPSRKARVFLKKIWGWQCGNRLVTGRGDRQVARGIVASLKNRTDIPSAQKRQAARKRMAWENGTLARSGPVCEGDSKKCPSLPGREWLRYFRTGGNACRPGGLSLPGISMPPLAGSCTKSRNLERIIFESISLERPQHRFVDAVSPPMPLSPIQLQQHYPGI